MMYNPKQENETHVYQIDVSHLDAGIYFLKLNSNKGESTEKVICVD